MRIGRFFALVAALMLASCAGQQQSASNSGGPINVVTTISTFNSIVASVGGIYVTVKNLVPVGASPETYQPTPQDVATLAQAQLLVENGAGLETWLAKTIANVGSTKLRTVVCSNGLTIREGNPHLWMDPINGKHYAIAIRDALIAMDPSHADQYRANARRYTAALDMQTKSIAARIASIPPAQRMMIIQHNAFVYYNARFGIRTLGVIEVNPGQDPNPQQLANLIKLAKQYHARAIFSEPEYSAKLAQQIAGNANIKVVSNLYDDSLGTLPQVQTYIGLLNYDTDVIVKSLR